MIKLKNSTHRGQEEARQTGQTLTRAHFQTRSKLGIITEIHEKFYAVKVLIDREGLAAAGKFFPLTNSWAEIIHNFGEIKIGMRVRIDFQGDQENFGSVTLIGREGEPIAQNQESADKLLSLYEIFTPGV